ncbi:hypothetical protein [Paracoccus aestuariivivens]|uniref:Outer membrane beta-barrel protein n=1 Tax=Paracoccus aestuariivivens TaxID=1820333 RepID=A0A6L6J9E4_9RHOB|nr:hypothetical protein [Paracoccus aestuariivivens]MTH77765.1 hypothetical protein [Paracoccus aestuariivivens]
MPQRIALGLVLLAALPSIAYAGAWPRAEKATFLSLSDERDSDGNSYTSLYGEYGLTGRETLGFELGYTNVGETSALFGLQHALEPWGENQLSVGLGIGMVARDGMFLPLAQASANWGRGFQGFMQGGWLSLETRLKVAGAMKDQADFADLSDSAFNYLTSEVTVKADFTVGLHATDAMMIINQFRFEQTDEAGFTSKLATTVVHDLWGPSKIELGLITPLSGPDESAVKLGTWLEF